MAGCALSTTLMALNFWTPPKSAGWVEADKALPRILRRGAAAICLQIAKRRYQTRGKASWPAVHLINADGRPYADPTPTGGDVRYD